MLRLFSKKRCFTIKMSVPCIQPVVIRRKFASQQIAATGPADIEFDTIVEMQQKACQLYANKPLFGTRVKNEYEWMKYSDFDSKVQLFRNVLSHHNIGKDDKVALISNNRVEWAVAMYAVAGMGGQLVPMYEAQLEKDWQYIIKDSSAKMLIVANETLYNKTKDYIGKVGALESVISFDSSAEYMHSYQRWMQLVANEKPVPPIEASPDDLLVLIYTSGTTGNPKGVQLSHKNVVANLRGLRTLWKDHLENNRTLAFLPWAHVFGQTTELYAMMASGSAMGIVSNRELIVDSIGLIKPNAIMSVPVLFNKVYDGVMKKIAASPPIRQKIFHTALKVARERNALLEFGKPVGPWLAFKHMLADKVVFAKIREALGGNIKYMASGGAATGITVLQFFEDIGVPICEGYGLTETSPVVSSGGISWATRRLGCCGPALEGVDLRIVDPETQEDLPADVDGEVCCAGDSIMVGYHNRPDANAEVFFFKDGKKFFRTGDLGRLVEGKFLKITGRIKEQFKLENGKYVVPAPLEDILARSQFIAQAYLYGINKPHTVAIIVPEMGELRAWAQKQGLPVDDTAALLADDSVKALLGDELVSTSVGVKSYERPQRWVAIAEPFTQENQMLTPKMSLRRNNILKAYSGLLDELYSGAKGTQLKRIPTAQHEE